MSLLLIKFQMSAITANPSILFNEGRSRIHSKHQRNYQKVSEVNLDDGAILSYLKAQQLHRTIAVFTAETHSSRHIQPIIKLLDQGSHSFQGQIKGLIGTIKELARGKQNFNPQKMLKVEFFIYIWYCVDHSQLNKARLSVLRDHIDKNGETLAEIPELLAYFALPYSDNPSTHPLLRKIFTGEWRENLKNEVLELIGRRQQHKMQQEWFNIIKDLIDISTELYKHIDSSSKTEILKTSMERVTLYKMVIEKNQSHSPLKQNVIQVSQKGKRVNELLDYGSIDKIKGILVDFNNDLLQNRRLGNQLQISKIYHGLQLQLISQREKGRDKLLVSRLAKNDILLFHSQNNMVFFRQNLKLAQLLSSYFIGRRYLESNKTFVAELKSVVLSNFKEQCSDYNMEMLYISFDILQKLVIRQTIFERVIAETDFIELLIKIFVYLRQKYIGSWNKQVQLAITANAAIIMAITMHRQGRRLFAKTSLFQQLILILQKMERRVGDEVLQKAVCSCIYLLLVEWEIRVRANSLKLKDILLDRMMRITSRDYETIVQYIIERSEIEEAIEDEDSDQDAQKSIQYDQTIEIHPDVIWHKNEKISLKQLEGISKGDQIQIDRARVNGKLQRHRSSEKKSKYSREKYSWKK